MFQQLLKYFTKRFAEKMGRSPQTASEFMSIQNDVVRYLNKTKGVPQGAPKPPFQGFTPKVIEGGKPKEGIGTLFKDSPERIAKIKADNKAALERLKNKKKTVEDFRDDGDFDPGGMASGGIAGQLHLNRPGYSGGTLVKSILNLLKGAGKKKNVWRGFETKYNKDFDYPEEFSGRFFTPDKELAKWYAMRQGTLTGKVKKLKLTEKEIKAAQEFAEKNLDIQYGGDLLVSKELAKKAKINLPSTALAKIEAVIRKAKGIGPFLQKTHKQKDKINKAEGGRASLSNGGLANILGV